MKTKTIEKNIRTEVTLFEFLSRIAKDFNLELRRKHETPFNRYPSVNGKKKIKAPYDAIIIDLDGAEHPYMLESGTRNNEKLIEFDRIYIIRTKDLWALSEEAGIKIHSANCKISEGGGWSSNGVRYFYKDIYCEC